MPPAAWGQRRSILMLFLQNVGELVVVRRLCCIHNATQIAICAPHIFRWFPLVNKSGKADKVRGDVLLGITFLRNNISASMVDLSIQDKPKSRMSKLKDKVRLKKKDSFSDSGSAMSHVLTDSDGDRDSLSSNQTQGEKKKSKLKNLFAPKSNLHRNSSQSMSTLGTLPSKNSSLSGSRSSGINVETPEVKKKFKFLGHKRSGSSDSKVSLGALSLLSRPKRSNSDLNNPSINSAQVNAEETEARSGSTLSLNSSGQGSMENVPQQTTSVLAAKSKPVLLFRSETRDRLRMEEQRRQEEEERNQIEAMRLQEEQERHKRLLEEEDRKQNEEYERNGRFLEDEARRVKQSEEEEEERRNREITEDEECRQLEEIKNEEQKTQGETSMSERLSSLFGIIKKKEERKEEAPQHTEEVTTQAHHNDTRDQQVLNAKSSSENISFSSTNQFSDSESPSDEQKSSASEQTSSTNHFLNRTARVSPRLTHSLDTESSSESHQVEYSDPQTTYRPVDQQWSSPSASESTLSSLPYDYPYTFSNLHSSLAPLRLRESPTGSTSKSLTGSPCESPPSSPRERPLFKSVPGIPAESLPGSRPGSPAECLPGSPAKSLPQSPAKSPLGSPSRSPPGSPSYSVDNVSSPTMADKTGRSPLPPLYPIYESQADKTLSPDREVLNLRQKDGSQQGKKLSLPLPDYETLFPQKRHGVQGHTRWDHIIAEVNQRNMDFTPELTGPEMSVDGPADPGQAELSYSEESSAVGHFRTHQQESKLRSSKKTAAPPPPKQVLTMHSRPISGSSQIESQNNGWTNESLTRSLPSGTADMQNNDKLTKESFSEISLDESKNGLRPSFLSARVTRSTSERDGDSATLAGQTKPLESTDIPTARPRQRPSMTAPTEHSAPISAFPDVQMSGSDQKNPTFNMSEVDKNGKNENSSDFHSYTRTNIISKLMGAPEKPSRSFDGIYTRGAKSEQIPENLGMTPDDLDKIFTEEKPVDPFPSLNGYETNKSVDEFRPISPVFKRQNSSKRISKPISRRNSQKALTSQQELNEHKTTKVQQELETQNIVIDSFTQRHPADGKAQAQLFDGEDAFAVSSTFPSSETLPVVTTEQSPQADVLSARNKPKKALLPPSMSQLVSPQVSNGDDLDSVSSRPHPVKPMHSLENQQTVSTSLQKNLHLQKGTAGKAAGMADSGPFTQLTHEELITLVVRQQADLSKKDCKIGELEEYIDNLLVRVIEEKPAILQAMNVTKPT
ncbi:rab11 family-interacting protein 1 isoform X2 [Corythoichthys intestinalis]|uniref:rab11 family-interacting protein 1 isoform X2 n=1 Tax=Corythoichthys intestinalis TaxID=161448 RepID=UPI0025A5C3B6|nr:rab11 family-interacting protein 1 isoform X2 [Corythoichthys intestinalis]